MEARFFATPAAFRKWLKANHAREKELWVGFHKVTTGKRSLAWSESVEEALCAGWIDGVRKRIDDGNYMIRFTPRKPSSTWSAVNIKRMAVLVEDGRALPAGIAAFARRSAKKSGIYSYEQRDFAKLDAAQAKQFRANRAAWKYFQAEAPWYRRTVTFWVASAKREETRARRFATLVASCAKGQRIAPVPAPARTK
jgi:uncharacterized protein YdeI (YjbR/CyaY-like superfamily)